MKRIVAVGLLVCTSFFLGTVTFAVAASTHAVQVGGEQAGTTFTKGVVWFNAYNPPVIILQPGDTVVFQNLGGVHTVTSANRTTDGQPLFDSSPIFTEQIALEDMGPGRLLPPGSKFQLDTSTLSPGTYAYVCRIHPGMAGTLTISGEPVGAQKVTLIAGFGDLFFAQHAFVPADISVPRGTIVEWVLLNPTEPHTITGADPAGGVAWDSSPDFQPPGPPPVLLPGDNFSFTFTAPGVYTYYCKVHAYNVGGQWAGMVGNVLVLPYASGADVAGLTGAAARAEEAASQIAGGMGLINAALGVAVVALIVGVVALVRKKEST